MVKINHQIAAHVLHALLIGLVMIAGMSPEALSDPSGTISVTSLGARADGKTDDTVALQSALDAAKLQGGVVRLPPGQDKG